MSNDNKKEKPGWVKLILWRVPSRVAAWVYFGLSVQVVICWPIFVFWFVDMEDLLEERLLLIGAVIFGIFALMGSITYYLAIRWMDKNNGWQ
jgi:hypothetical protein